MQVVLEEKKTGVWGNINQAGQQCKEIEGR